MITNITANMYNIALQNSRRKLPREIEFNIGFCKMKNDDYKGAIEHFTKATEKNDESKKEKERNNHEEKTVQRQGPYKICLL